ncbi:MAG: penicillin-binding transpeptidase domain-containing protein [Acidaminobacteraceae bacterium]
METSSKNRGRLLIAMFLVLAIFSILIGRLAWIQVIRGDDYKKMAINQQVKDIELPAKRGTINDRNGMKLAFSVVTYDVYIRPENINRKYKDRPAENIVHRDKVVEHISPIIAMSESDILDELNSGKSLIKLAKGLNKSQADLIRNMNTRGVWVAENNKRVYPYSNFASHVLGHTNIDNIGIAGIEYYYEKELRGISGKFITSTDVQGRPLPYYDEEVFEPVQGYNLTLTIDEVIQHFTERAIDKAYEEHGAKKVMAIVMDPSTGEILAMSTKPDYNPNQPRDLSSLFTPEELEVMSVDDLMKNWNERWRNPIIGDTYEPGSVMKLVTSAIGIEENVTYPSKEYYDKGYADIYGTRIYNWRRNNPFEEQTLTQALENSVNTIFIDIGQNLGEETLYRYFDSFGMFNKTGIDLPAEGSSLYLKKEKAGPVDNATMTFGGGMSNTPIQVITALSATVNGGNLMEPHMVKAFTDDNGEIIKSIAPKLIRSVVSKKTSDDIRLMMESVVINGSAKKAYIPGIRVGGKTGTSEKLVNGQYSDVLAYSSFFGVAPVDDPKLTVLVIVDEPEDTNYGSVVAAPIAKSILEDSLRYLKIEPEFKSVLKTIAVPDLVGKTLEQSEKIVTASGLALSTVPIKVDDKSMIVTKQYPLSGSIASEKSSLILYFGK